MSDSLTTASRFLAGLGTTRVGWKASTPWADRYSHAALSLPYVARRTCQRRIPPWSSCRPEACAGGSALLVDTPVSEPCACSGLRTSGMTSGASPMWDSWRMRLVASISTTPNLSKQKRSVGHKKAWNRPLSIPRTEALATAHHCRTDNDRAHAV